MKFEVPPELQVPVRYNKWIEDEEARGHSDDREAAVKNVELGLFNERIGRFEESALTQDGDRSWSTFEQKIKFVFPELPDDRLKATKAGITMHLCGL